MRQDVGPCIRVYGRPVMPQMVPPKMDPPRPSVANNYVAMDGPPDQVRLS